MNRLKMMAAVALAAASMAWQAASATEQVLESPDGNLRMTFTLTPDGTPQFFMLCRDRSGGSHRLNDVARALFEAFHTAGAF